MAQTVSVSWLNWFSKIAACGCLLLLSGISVETSAFGQDASNAAIVQSEPTAANAPHKITELDCRVAFMTLPREMLIPQINMRLPKFDESMFASMRRHMMFDPAQLCRYRDQNLTLSHQSSHRVVFLGDSITEAWSQASPSLFKGEVLNRGISGQTTTQMLLRFREDVLSLHPAVLHIMAGVNDLNTPSGAVLTKSNIQSMVELAKFHNITIILGSITPANRFWISPDVKPGPQIVELNEWIKLYAAENHLIYVNYWAPLQDGALGFRTEFSNEGLHPNQEGYDIMTPLAERALSQAFARRSKGGH